MAVLRDMAVKEGYVNPSFLKNIQEIDRFSQMIRHHMVIAIAPKKQEDVTVNPKDLLNQVKEQL